MTTTITHYQKQEDLLLQVLREVESTILINNCVCYAKKNEEKSNAHTIELGAQT